MIFNCLLNYFFRLSLKKFNVPTFPRFIWRIIFLKLLKFCCKQQINVQSISNCFHSLLIKFVKFSIRSKKFQELPNLRKFACWLTYLDRNVGARCFGFRYSVSRENICVSSNLDRNRTARYVFARFFIFARYFLSVWHWYFFFFLDIPSNVVVGGNRFSVSVTLSFFVQCVFLFTALKSSIFYTQPLWLNINSNVILISAW